MEIRKILAALACLGLAGAAKAEVDFDRGIDVKDVIEQARSSDVKSPYPYYGPHRVRYSRDCRNFNYSNGDPQSSEKVYLESVEYIEDCRFTPKPPPSPAPPPQPGHNPGPPNPHGQPKASEVKDYYPGQPGYQYHSGDSGPHGNYSYIGNYGGQEGIWYCHERIGRTFRATAQLNVPARQMYPWESESFEVCQQGDRQDFITRHSPYRYSVGRNGFYDVAYDLTPTYRSPTAPDPEGLTAVSLAFRDGKFVLDVADRWVSYYAGEKLMIEVELFKDGVAFFNTSKGKKQFLLETAPSYELVFAESELEKPESGPNPDDPLDIFKDARGARRYFVKWGFKRIGAVSTDRFMDKGKTGKVEAR